MDYGSPHIDVVMRMRMAVPPIVVVVAMPACASLALALFHILKPQRNDHIIRYIQFLGRGKARAKKYERAARMDEAEHEIRQ